MAGGSSQALKREGQAVGSAEEMEVLRNGTERNRQLRALLMADLMEAGA